VLAAKGMAAFLKIASRLAPAPTAAAPSIRAQADAVAGMEGQLVRILAGMVLAHAP
jgi:hypothetical protein